jgi:hypothetical protein
MKKGLLKGFTMLTLIVVIALVSAVATANAQTSNKVVANIPFEFSVGYKSLPAGEYIVQTIASANDAVLVQSADGKSSALRLTESTADKRNKSSHARLVFHRYGERYFLAQTWGGADRPGRQLLKSQEERALQQELASIAAKGGSAPTAYEIVEVVAVLR